MIVKLHTQPLHLRKLLQIHQHAPHTPLQHALHILKHRLSGIFVTRRCTDKVDLSDAAVETRVCGDGGDGGPAAGGVAKDESAEDEGREQGAEVVRCATPGEEGAVDGDGAVFARFGGFVG